MDDLAAAIARLQHERARCDELKARWAELRGYHRWRLWLDRVVMLINVCLICSNVVRIGADPSPFWTWFSGAVTALLFWSFCNTWRFSESRWADYLRELTLIEESARSIDATIERVKGMHAHQD